VWDWGGGGGGEIGSCEDNKKTSYSIQGVESSFQLDYQEFASIQMVRLISCNIYLNKIL